MRWFSRLAVPILVLLGCGEIELEGPEQRWPARRCEEWEVFDPETGLCRSAPCVFDEDCPEGERCDRIEGICKA